MSTMTIVDVATHCDLQAAIHRRLFELLGTWAADDAEPARQRWYATAAHRHAWHAELWAQRRPVIPDSPTADAAAAIDPPDDADGRFAWYRATLDRLVADTERAAEHFDPVLDPGSVRVARLVSNDLAELAATAP